MPWCEDCSRFWNPNSLPPDGTCPTCGRMIAEPPDTRVPWHFWGLLGALVLYLGWRAVQGLGWLVDHDRGPWAVFFAVLLVVLIAGFAAWNWWPTDEQDEPPGHEPSA